MPHSSEFEFNDVQALVRFGHGKLTETRFMLLDVADADAAKRWLRTAPISRAVAVKPPPDTALQISFSVAGLRALGLRESIIQEFSDEFITGMAGEEARSRRLGDTGRNAPQHWQWGGAPDTVPHLLLMLYAGKGDMDAWRKNVEAPPFGEAFQVRHVLPTDDIGSIEPFGFADGISQPNIDWAGRQSTDPHERDRYSNWVAPGEFVLGYPNEYGLYTDRPLIDPQDSTKDRDEALALSDAEDQPGMKDFGRNGTYLVIRQLHQDVPGFWQYLHRAAGEVPEQREKIAAGMVGRQRDGTPLVSPTREPIGGTPQHDPKNHFTYENDPHGHRCPVGAHIRRSNPRTGDLPPGVNGIFSRLMKMLGFGQNPPEEDLIASTRFHRLLRRGRGYGPLISPEDAVKPDAPAAERGLQFITLAANILRQFEFVQNAWTMSSKFGGVQQERDPLLGTREPLLGGDATDQFHHPDPDGPICKTGPLPQFVTVRGGGYFFMPGLRAIQYLAAIPTTESEGQP
jgi:deferrochelatase/peroxidase EfeB